MKTHFTVLVLLTMMLGQPRALAFDKEEENNNKEIFTDVQVYTALSLFLLYLSFALADEPLAKF